MESVSEWTFTKWFLCDLNLGWHWAWINQRFFPVHWWTKFLFHDEEAVSLSSNCLGVWLFSPVNFRDLPFFSLDLIFEVPHIFVTFCRCIFLMGLSLLFSKAFNFLHKILSLRNSFSRFRTVKIDVAQLFDIFQKIIQLIFVLELVFIGQQFNKHIKMSLIASHGWVSSFTQRQRDRSWVWDKTSKINCRMT